MFPMYSVRRSTTAGLRRGTRMLTLSTLFLAAAVSACGSDATAPAFEEEELYEAAEDILLSSSELSLAPGETATLEAVLLGAHGAPIVAPSAGRIVAAPVSFTSDAPAVASVSATGIIAAGQEGEAIILVASGNLRASAVVTVNASTSREPAAEQPEDRAPNAGTFHVPASIDATGGNNVTAELNAWFRSVPDGATLKFRAGARYRTEGTLLLEERRGLTIEGEGAEFFVTTRQPIANPTSSAQRKTNRTRAHWRIDGGSDITIRNLRLKGPHPQAGTGSPAYVSDLEAQHGFDIGGTKGITLDNIRITDVYGDFVYLGRWKTDSNWVDGAVIRGSHFERNGRQGIAITGARNVLIEGNWIGEVRRSVFDIEPNTERGGGVNITIRGNTIGEARLRWLAAHGRAGKVENIVIENNTGRTAMNITVESPSGSRRGPFRIVNNRMSQGYGTPQARLMHFAGIDGLEVRNNRNPLQAGRDMVFVQVERSCGVTIAGNEFPGGVGEARIAPFTCDK